MKISSPGIVYRLLSLPLLLLWFAHALRHGRRYLAMRCFGFAANHSAAAIWIHAASVGEVEAVTPLLRSLLQSGENLLVTSFTATGYQAIQKNFGRSIDSGVIPFDFYWNCRRFYQRHEIRLGLIMETELWPELLYQARRRDIPLLQINARLSTKSLAAPPTIRRFLKTTLSYFSQILARSEGDRDLLLQLGAAPDRIRVQGNLKSGERSISPPQRLIERDYIILASSHAGEERQFLEARPDQFDDCLLTIAPRHPGRAQSIRVLLDQLGMSYAQRSASQPVEASTQVYLADTLGELKALMAHALVVVMGGSFDHTGGHNLIEPASLGCAIITGPSDENIVDDIRMLEDGKGLIQVADMRSCWRQIRALLDHPQRAQALGREARNRLARQPDIIAVYLASIRPWL